MSQDNKLSGLFLTAKLYTHTCTHKCKSTRKSRNPVSLSKHSSLCYITRLHQRHYLPQASLSSSFLHVLPWSPIKWPYRHRIWESVWRAAVGQIPTSLTRVKDDLGVYFNGVQITLSPLMINTTNLSIENNPLHAECAGVCVCVCVCVLIPRPKKVMVTLTFPCKA